MGTQSLYSSVKVFIIVVNFFGKRSKHDDEFHGPSCNSINEKKTLVLAVTKEIVNS